MTVIWVACAQEINLDKEKAYCLAIVDKMKGQDPEITGIDFGTIETQQKKGEPK